MAAKPCPNLARTHALYMRFPLCFHCVLPYASLTFPVFLTQFRYEQASNSIGFRVCPASRNRRKATLAPIAQLLHARQRSLKRSNDLFTFFLSRVHSCTIRLISLFPMTKNARYGRINFCGRLAQRERRSLTRTRSGGSNPSSPTTGYEETRRMIRRVSFSLLTTTAESKTRDEPMFHVKHTAKRAHRVRRPSLPLLAFRSPVLHAGYGAAGHLP